MSQSQHDEERLLELVSRHWGNEEITDADAAEINDLVLKLGAAGSDLLMQFSSMQLGIRNYVASSNVHQNAMASLWQTVGLPAECHTTTTSSLLTEISADGSAETARRIDHPDSGRVASVHLNPLRSPLTLWSASAVLVALFLCLFLALPAWRDQAAISLSNRSIEARVIPVLHRPTQPIATLVRADAAVWGGGIAITPGENLLEKQRIELVSGTAQISFACGVDLVLRAPSVVTLTADNYATLERGTVIAHAAKWATGFVVEADDLQIIDLGTRFAILADEGGTTEAHVLEGNVLAAPMKSRRPRKTSMLLSSGEAIRVDGARAQVELFEARHSDFNDLTTSFLPMKPINLWNTGIGRSVGDQDLQWNIVAGLPENGPYPRPASVIDGVKGPYLDNHPESSQWISVSKSSWPGSAPDAVHTYETRFDLTGFDLSTVYIVGHFLVDDTINELRINGQPVDFENWETTWNNYDFQSFHPIEITSGFQPGENVISIDVYNNLTEPPRGSTAINPGPNPTGLRVEWQAFGRQIPQ